MRFIKIPALDGDIVEVRQVFDMEDFPADVQDALLRTMGARS